MLENLIAFVEEESMEAALTSILPKLIPEASFQVIRFEGKPDMLRNLTARLRGFRTWLPENWLLLVLVDRDGDSCEDLKRCLETIAAQSGLISKSSGRRDSRFQVVNRVVIEELESWFFGDWEAVQRVYPKVPRTIPGNPRYSNPDAVAGGTWEALERILQRAGYFKSGLRKIELARTVSPHMVPARNTSRSFQVLCEAIAAAMAL